MQTGNEIKTIEDQGWVVRVKPPDNPSGARTMLLLHGRTGDENVMWIFTRSLEKCYWMFSPRAPQKDPDTGYAWLPHAEAWPMMDVFEPIARQLLTAFDRWSKHEGAASESFDVMGFSQGAAMAYALATFFPERVGRILALAGFLPRWEDPERTFSMFLGKQVYIAHGSQDTIVPVRMAEEAVAVLQHVGADVTYCASDVGHKLSAPCLRGLDAFLFGEK